MHAWAEVFHQLQSSMSSSQASYAVLAGESQAFFKHSPLTNSIPYSAILRSNYISLLKVQSSKFKVQSDLCACVHVKKNGVVKEAIVLQWAVPIPSCNFKPGKSDGLVHCSVKNGAVLCENHRERVTQIWTSPSGEEEEEEEEEEERKKNILAVWWLSGSVLSRCFFSATGSVVRHENTQRWTVGCYNSL